MYEESNLKSTSTIACRPVGTVTQYDGLNYMYVSVAANQRLFGGDSVQIDAVYAATPVIANGKIDGVVQWDMEIDAVSAAQYAWVIVPGGANAKNIQVNAVPSTGGSTPTSVTDWTNSGLVSGGKLSNGEWYIGAVQPTAMPTALGTATSGTDYSAYINQINANIVNLRMAGLRGVSALSAFSATGTPASAGMFKPKRVYYATAANSCAISASGSSDSATPISADWRAGDIMVYKGEARVVISATTAGAAVSGGFLINSGMTTAASGTLDNNYLRIGKYRVKAIWDK